MERRISPLHIVALVITSLVFIIGILIGVQIGSAAEGQMRGELEELKSESYMLEVISLMRERGEMSCPTLENAFSELSGKTVEYGKRIEYLEVKLGKLDPEVMRLKSDYMLMQARNYLLLGQMDEECGTEHLAIIYFYTNEGYSPSTDQGIAIDNALGSLPELRGRAVVYHFDVNVRNAVVEALKDRYSVETVPTIVVGGVRYEGYRDAGECREIFSGAG